MTDIHSKDTERDATAADQFITLEDDKKERPVKKLLNKGVLGGLAVCCVVLLVVSLGFVQPGKDGGWSIAWLMPETGTSAVAGSASLDDASTDVASSDDSGSAQKGTSTNESGASTVEDDTQDIKSDAQSNDATAQSNTSGNNALVDNDNSVEQSASNSSQHASQNQSSSTSQSAGQTQSAPQVPQRITVSVVIDSSVVGGPVSATGTVEVNAGATVYDALMTLAQRSGISVNASDTAFGVYVSSIGGLAEKSHGAQSGWVFTVNGQRINVSASSYTLSNGDSVYWSFVTSAS